MSGMLGGGYAIELWHAEDAPAHPETRLLDDVWAELRHEPWLDASAVTVQVDAAGAATLSGAVSTYPQKKAASRAAGRVPGVARVANEITVRLAPAHERTDAALARMARQALEWNVLVPVGSVSVAVTGGVVRLDGEFDRDADRRVAEATVERLVGVRGVTSQAVLRPAVLPRDVRSRVEESLRRSLGTEGRHVHVSVRAGAPVLQGHVRTLAHRDSAERAALAVQGVTHVENDVLVRPWRWWRTRM